jgi:DNA-binding transcriptional ArsR family regulator
MEQLTDISPVELASVASAVSDSGRAAILISLLDGRARTATELAFVAGITPRTASGHLARLVEAAWSPWRRKGGIASPPRQRGGSPRDGGAGGHRRRATAAP